MCVRKDHRCEPLHPASHCTTISIPRVPPSWAWGLSLRKGSNMYLHGQCPGVEAPLSKPRPCLVRWTDERWTMCFKCPGPVDMSKFIFTHMTPLQHLACTSGPEMRAHDAFRCELRGCGLRNGWFVRTFVGVLSSHRGLRKQPPKDRRSS